VGGRAILPEEPGELGRRDVLGKGVRAGGDEPKRVFGDEDGEEVGQGRPRDG